MLFVDGNAMNVFSRGGRPELSYYRSLNQITKELSFELSFELKFELRFKLSFELSFEVSCQSNVLC